MSKRHYGKVISKTEYLDLLGPAIALGVVKKDYTEKQYEGVKIFENAAWTLEKFQTGEEVTWLTSWWRSLIDPRGTGSLEKIVEGGK